MLHVFLLAAALGTPDPLFTPTPRPYVTPAPTVFHASAIPTEPPEIYHGVVSPDCTTLNEVMMPIGYISRFNDAAYFNMAISMQKFAAHFMPGDAPTVADISAALGGWNSNGVTNMQGRQYNPSSSGTGTPATTGASSSLDDDTVTFGPQQTIDAARVDAVVQQIFQNVNLERKYLDDSYKTYPQGHYANVDAMRARVQNLITLQTALANRYEKFAGTYLDSMGLAQMTYSSQSDLALMKLTLRGLLMGDAAGLTSTTGDPSNFTSADDLARSGSAGQIVAGTRKAEFEFSKSLIRTFDSCHGTKTTVIIASPSPQP